MWFKRAMAFLILSNIVNISAADLHGMKFTQNNRKSFFQAAQASASLSAEEKKLLAEYTERVKKEDPRYPASLYGKTVGQMLAEQRAQAAEERLKAERAKAAIDTDLRKSLDVSLREKSPVAIPTTTDPEGKQVKLWFIFAVKNNAGRPIKGYQGTVILTDLFGKKIATLAIEVVSPDPIPAGNTVDWYLSSPITNGDPVDLKISSTALEAMRVEWVPMSIIFGDGTRLGESGGFESGVKPLYDEELFQTPESDDSADSEDDSEDDAGSEE